METSHSQYGKIGSGLGVQVGIVVKNEVNYRTVQCAKVADGT